MKAHNNVAIYCYGEHTKALMREYIFELRSIMYIVDNGNIDAKYQGFTIIKDDDLEFYGIDGVIISTYQYREEIKGVLTKNHKKIDFLDFYDVMHSSGINIECEFYKFKTPYENYIEINELYQKINKKKNTSCFLIELLEKYLEIKDFRLASKAAEALYKENNEPEYLELINDINGLYEDCLNVLKLKGENAVLLMCIDGLKAEEFCEKGHLSNTYHVVKSRAEIFEWAYSYSTSTYESLVPVFSENYDQNTNYMSSSDIPIKKCRFASFAKKQGRNIYVYSGGVKHILDPGIKYIEYAQTITQMIWSFLHDLENDPNGLFFMRPLYESHFTFPSPYFQGRNLVVDGTSVFFDYLSTKGGKLRVKYSDQYETSMNYIDDTLVPFFEHISCGTFLFADHGNYNYKMIECTKLEDMDAHQMTVAESLIRIPMAVFSPTGGGQNTRLISLMELNNIAISLMENKKFEYCKKYYIKIGRTAIYNPDYKYIFKYILHSEHSLCAFEGFVFEDGYKLIVYSNGVKELYKVAEDCIVENIELVEKYYKLIEKEISII